MERNRLQTELERQRASGRRRIIDLADTNFHANGLRFSDTELSGLFEDYLRNRSYRPDPKGTPAARRAISEYYRAEGLQIDPDQLLVTASTSESYSLLFSSLCDAGDNVVLPRPTYPLFEYLADYARLEPRYYDLSFDEGFRLDIDSVRGRIDDRTKFVVLISPNNPTGQVADTEEIDELLELCAASETMIVSDEVFSGFLYPGSSSSPPGGLPRPAARSREVPIFTLNGISKMFASPDLKLAWIAASGASRRLGDLLDRLEMANDTFLSCSSLSQHILPGLFERGEELASRMRQRLLENRSVLLASLACPDDGPPARRPLRCARGMRVVPPTGGIHCVIGVPRGSDSRFCDDEEFAVRLLREANLYVHPGYFYGIDETKEELYLVVSFLTERGRLAEGLERLVSFL